MRTLIAAAYPPELERLAALMPAAMARGRVMTRALGIGLVEAAAGAERAVMELQPERLLLVGTAGALPGSGLAIGDVVVAEAAFLSFVFLHLGQDPSQHRCLRCRLQQTNQSLQCVRRSHQSRLQGFAPGVSVRLRLFVRRSPQR